jgi:hypothetical protein
MMVAKLSGYSSNVVVTIFLIAFCAGACSNIPEQASTQTIEVVATDLPETSTATVVVVDTPTTVLEEPESTPTATPIVYPTMSVEEAKDVVRALIANNGGCDLPCWWGITPGDTLWSDVEPYLISIADEFSYFSQSDLQEMYIWAHLDLYHFSWKLDEFQRDISVGFYVNPDGVVEVIGSGVPTTQKNFQISQLLLDFGNPEEIKVDLLTEFAGGGVYYNLELFYPGHGFVAAYEGEGKVVENKMSVCVGDTGPSLYMRSPKCLSLNSLFQLKQRDGWGASRNLPSINEFPELSIESFAEIMKDPSGCVFFPLE